MATGDGTRLLLLPLLLVVGSRCAMAQPSPPSPDAMNDYFAPASFNSSVAILIVVLVSAFFFLGFFSIYIRRCGGDPFGGGGGVSLRAGVSALGGVMARSRRQRGLDPAVLETFPMLAFAEVKELRIEKGSLECAVCLSEFEDDETLRLLPKCSHAFHPDCIDVWLDSHVTCPVCRCNLVPDPDASSPPPAPDPDAAPDSSGAGAGAEPTPLAREAEAGGAAVVIDVADEEREERRKQDAIELQRIGSQRQAIRARSGRRPARFPRSHSTGHSLTTAPAAAPVPVPVMAEVAEGNHDRYTLRLPEHIRREIVAAGRLKRTRSLLSFPSGGEESSRRGYRGGGGGGGGGGEGSSRGGRSIRLGRSERWPNFFTRTFSGRVPAWATGRRSVEGSVKKGEGEGSTRGKLAAAAVSPFDCFAAASAKGCAAEEDDESSTAALARRV